MTLSNVASTISFTLSTSLAAMRCKPTENIDSRIKPLYLNSKQILLRQVQVPSATSLVDTIRTVYYFILFTVFSKCQQTAYYQENSEENKMQ